MLQPDKLKKLNENALKMSEAGNSTEEILAMKDAFIKQFGSEVEKKNPNDTTSTSTTPTGNSDSVQKNGSSDFQSPKFGADLIVEANKQVSQIPEPKINLNKPEKPKKERGFLSEVWHKLAKGSSQLGADIAAAPELIYDAFSAPQNAVADMFNIPSLKTDSEKLKTTVGVRNLVKDYYRQEVSKLKQESDLIDKKYQAGVYDSFKNGDYTDGFRQLTNSFAESLPATASIMVGGAYAKAPQLLAASTAVFGANKNEQLKEENPNMNENARITNALASGLAESAFETIGSGSIGSAAKALIEREGKQKAATILKDGLVNFYKESLKKNPLMASMTGEGIEEWATQVTQNSIDVATGVKPQGFNVFEGATDAFIGGAFGGAVFGGGLKGIEQIANAQDKNTVKSNFKKTFELQKQLANPDISEAVQKELHSNINKLVKENQQIISRNVKHADNLDEKVQGKLSESIYKMEEIKNKISEIKLDKNTSDESKQILLDNLKQEYQKANDLKADILDGKTSVVDVLPLKEQDKLKREALKELTQELNPDGTKNITITNEQIVERANKLYKTEQENLIKEENAKTETEVTEPIETQPQAEVQEPTIANEEKVTFTKQPVQEQIGYKRNMETGEMIPVLPAEVQIVESEDGFKIWNGKNNTYEEGTNEQGIAPSYKTKEEAQLRLEELTNEATPREDIADNGTLGIGTEPISEVAIEEKPTAEVSETKVVEPAIESKPSEKSIEGEPLEEKQFFKKYKAIHKDIRSKGESEKMATAEKIKKEGLNKGNNVNAMPLYKGVESGTDQSSMWHKYKKGDVVYLLPKEGVVDGANGYMTKKGHIPTDAEVVTIQFDGQNAYDAYKGQFKGKDVEDSEVKENVKRVKSAKDIEYDVQFDENGKVTKINSVKDGREITKFFEKTNPITKKKTLAKNPNYTRIEADALGVITDSQSKTEEKQKYKDAIQNFTPVNEYDVALQALARGAKVSPESLESEIGNKDSKWATNQSTDKKLDSFETLAENIVNANENLNLDENDVRSALIDIVNTHASLDKVRESIIRATEENSARLQEQEARAYLDGLTDKEIAMYESVKAEEEYLSELSDKEVEEYYNQKINEYENATTEATNEKPSDIAKSDEGKGGEKKSVRQEKIDIYNAKIDDIANALKDLLPKGFDTDGLKKNGFSQDELIDIIAKATKVLVNTGIDVNEAIRQVIEKLKENFDGFNVSEKDVFDKHFAKETVSKDELSNFRDLIRDIPQKEEVKNYLSGETIERVYGEKPTNDQSYNVVSLADLSEHGKLVMNKAKELFGDQYVEKTLDFLENSNLEADEKAIQYVALENEMDKRVSENPNDLGERKLQELVNSKSQAHLRKSAIAINAGRLRAIMKYGIDINSYPNGILTSKQKQAKAEIEKLVQHTSEDINKEAEKQEEDGGFIISETEKEIKSNTKKAKEVANKIRQYKIHKPSVFSSASPGSLAWDGAIEIIAKTVEAGGTLADAIQKGIEHIKTTDWYKGLKDDKKKEAEDAIKDRVEKALKPKDKKISEIVKQALIDAGFSRKVKIKGEEKTLLDWKKLAGEESSIPKLKSNVEKSLKEQGYTDAQIKEIGKSLEDEYIRLGADIVEKGLRELENRNKIRPTPNRKSEAKRLSELYNYGLFNGEKATEYDNLLNKTLGLSEFDVETYQKIKELAKALASVYNQENNGKKISELAVQSLNSTINHQIKSLLAESALKNGTKVFNVISALDDYVGLSMRALLGSVSTLAENKLSGEYQVALQKMFSSGEITPELAKQIKADKKAVVKDITRNAGLFYGDTNTSLTHNSRFENWLNGKADTEMAHLVISGFMLRAFLDGVDSSVKVRLTQRAFVKNVVKLLTSESNPNGKMTTEEAVKYVSEQLTGENFEKALETAKSIIENVNKEQGKTVIKDTDEAIRRFAMDLVKENLLASDMLTMDNIESAYKAAYKSSGRSIGHEANNPISAGVNLLSSTINKRLEKAIQEKNYALATSLTLVSTIQKSILNPFVGGGTNWVILGLEKAGLPGAISVIHNATERRKLDLSENKTDITHSLYREAVYKDSAVRALVGTAMSMALFGALTAGDDDEELLGKLNTWIKDNPWVKKHFNKLSPEAVTFLIDQENGELAKHYQKVLGMKNDYFDNTKNLIKTFSDENSSMSGAFGAFLGQNLNSPGPWKTIKDVRDISRGLKGLPEIKTDYKVDGFWNGYFRAGFIDFAKLRPGVNYEMNMKIDKVKEEAKQLNSDIDEFVKDIYDKKLSQSQIDNKLNEIFSKEPLKKEKIKDALKNRAKEQELKRSGVDPFYIKLKRESNDEIKAILFQDRFKDLSKTTPAEQKEIEKGMNAIKFKGSPEFWDTYWKLSKPEMFDKKDNP